MKVFISADMEGITGATQWADVTIGEWNYASLHTQLHREVTAACAGAMAAGATDVWIKDGHDSGRNLDPQALPAGVTLVRGWSGHPYSMIQGLDASFTALICIGYHSGAGSGAHPLAHTLNPDLAAVRLNGDQLAEFHLMAYAAATVNVPTIFVSGDQDLCETIHTFNPAIVTVATQQGQGESVIVHSPQNICEQIHLGVKQALGDSTQIGIPVIPSSLSLEVVYKHPPQAYRRSFYPGACLISDCTIQFQASHWFEVMRALRFIAF